MNQISQHNMLLVGDSFDHCREQVHKFFDLTSLVVYDCIEAVKAQSFSSLDADFLDRILAAEEHNRRVVRKLINELVQAKIERTEDFLNIEQGYLSKTLHIMTHFLDGFIGVDSYFYNLIDDSHWLPPATARAIRENSHHYWLLHVNCFATTAEEAGFLRF
ncbi:hypothetical protein FCL47_00520 [Desulfopila sp. IMCC35006]|uniref:hypothetical protein n=1 Tax=Desulfopila sp. IMCC35006 TaxID=2569542 RepID=UPI0010ABCF26|nr:hypothetical protein [Desulfopila sp. IMCC35006]TKB28012.1 hypothetical protein FCL47_00520 [Desulfopila sp. IMCC35006]